MDLWQNFTLNVQKRFDFSLVLVFILIAFLIRATVCQVAGSEEGEVAWCSTLTQREGELWVLWVGQDAATARCHHQPAGQSLHHPPHHQLPKDEGFRQPGRPAMEPAHRRTTTQHLSQRSEVTPCHKICLFSSWLYYRNCCTAPDIFILYSYIPSNKHKIQRKRRTPNKNYKWRQLIQPLSTKTYIRS